MPETPFISLVHNAALLLALVLVYDLVVSRYPLAGNRVRQLAFGLVLGVMGIGIMLAPFQFVTGIVFDTRSVLLAVSGLFFGFIPTLVAMLLTAAYRLSQGGAAAWVGVGVIFASGGLGLLWRRRHHPRLAELSWWQVYSLGVVVHVVMLLLMLPLGWPTAREVLQVITGPVLIIYPVATGALGLLLCNRLQREKTGAALQESEQRYRTLFENQHTVMLLIDPADGAIVDANPAATAFYGWSREELRRKKISEINQLPPAEVAALMKQAQGRERSSFFLPHRLADGRVRQVEAFSNPITLGGRSLLYSIVIDITERGQAEVALRESQSLYRSFLDQLPAAVFRKDRSGRYVMVNPMFCRLKGLQAEDFIGRTAAEIAALQVSRQGDEGPATKYAQEGERIQQRILRTGEVVETEEKYRGVDGRPLFMHVVRMPVFAADGTIIGVQGIQINITERKQAEAESARLLTEAGRSRQALLSVVEDHQLTLRALRQSEELYRLIAENTSDVIWLYDLATERLSYMSPSIERMTGYTREEVMQGGLTDPLTPESAAEARRLIQSRLGELAAGGRPSLVDVSLFDHRHKDGSTRVGEVITTILCNEAGQPAQILGVTRDITERRQAEEQLLKLSRAVEQSPTSIVITDLAGAIEYVNPRFSTLTGYTAEEVRGRNPRLLKSDQTPPEVYQEMWQTLTAGRTWRGELVNRKKNGELFTELAVLAPVIGPRGKPTHYVAVKQDITEQKRIETTARETLQRFNTELEQQVAQRTRELAVSEERMRLVLRASSIGVFEVDLTTGAGTWNDVEFELLGLKPGEAPSNTSTLFRYVHPDDLGALIVQWEQALHTGNFETEFRIVRTDGQERWLAGKGRFASEGGQGGKAGRFFGVNYDITARKRLETETAVLLERERQVSEMKTRFISMTSHEFRTPMTTIMGSVELLANHLDRLAPQKRAELFERVNASLQRMTNMLDDVLALNRMDANRVEVRLATVNLAPLVQGMIQEIRTGDRNAHPLTVQLPGEDVPFITDAGLFHHILSNLLSNAVRYSPAGAPVTVRLEREPWQLRLVVEDRGIGIPPADRARIFEPFERGSNVGNVKGTGLGLNIVKRMTELLGGTATLDPVDGGGSRFIITLPQLESPPPRP